MQRRLVLALFTSFLCACESDDEDKAAERKTVDVTVKIQNIDTAIGLYNSPREPELSLLEQPYVTQRSFTPVSYKFPIMKIEMFGSDVTAGTVYECPGTTPEECLVDLADKDAVAALIKDPIPVSYLVGSDPKIVKFEVVVNSAGSAFNVKVKGTLDVAGTTYYTTSQETDKVLTSDQSKYSEVAIPMTTGTMAWYLPSPVSVTGVADADNIVSSGEVNVRLFVTMRDAAWANPASSNNNPACISTSSGAGTFVCASMAVPYPYVGSATPTISSYKVSEAANGNLAVVHVATLNGEGIGAFTRPYFDGTAMGSSSCKAGSWLKGLAKNSDGTYKFTIAQSDTESFDLFSSFQLGAHSGTCRDLGGSTYSYTASAL